MLEVAHATDYPGISRDKHGEIGLGKGPAIRIGPNMHPRLTKFIMNVADELHIPFQVVVQNKPTGTDGRQIQITRSGVATAVLSIPLRYMHTNIEVISPADVGLLVTLLEKAISTLPRDFQLNL